MPHDAHSPCSAQRAFARVHAAELAVLADALEPEERERLAVAAGISRQGGKANLPQRIRSRLADMDAGSAHEVAGWLVGPLVTSLEARLADSAASREGIRDAILSLFTEWPPGLVRVLIELLREARALPEAVLGRGEVEALAREHGALPLDEGGAA